MALFQLEIEKVLGGESWVNSYWLEGDAISDVVSRANQIVAAERAVHHSSITFSKYNLRTGTVGDEVYITAPLNVLGLADFGGSGMMPLFVVARVDFQAEVGRPSRKYLRGCLSEGDVNFDLLDTGRREEIDDAYSEIVAAIAEFVDVDGDAIIAGTCNPKTGMRQLRRGSKKSNTP